MAKARQNVVLGWEDLSKALREFPAELQQKAVKRGLRKGLKLVREEAARLVPKRTGLLAAQLRSTLSTKNKPGEIRGGVGVKKGKFYLREDGKLDRKLKAGVNYRVKVRKGGRVRVVVVHPRRYAHLVEFGSKNNRPAAFLRGAARAKGPEVLVEVERSIQRFLRSEMRKAGKR